MNNFYHKVAVTSICTILSFTLAANKEVKAAILSPSAAFSLTPDRGYYPNLLVGGINGVPVNSLFEFNISSLPPNTSNFTLSLQSEYSYTFYPSYLYIFGYVGNGQPDTSDYYEVGVFIKDVPINVGGYPSISPGDSINVDVTSFVSQLLNQGNTFAGFKVSGSLDGQLSLMPPSGSFLNIEDNVPNPPPVPEPTTIFGSTLALGVGGWLKRKKIKPAE